MLRIAHLVDTTGPGAVTGYLDFLSRDPVMKAFAHHDIIRVPRGNPGARQIQADIIISHVAISWRALPGLMLARARNAGTPMVHVEHVCSAGYVAHNVTARRRFQTLLRCAYGLFDRVVAVSDDQATWLRGRGLVTAQALSVIRPCTDLSTFRALPAVAGRVRTFGLIGPLERQQGFDIAIEAFRSLPNPDLRLTIFGAGSQAGALRQSAGNDARIRFRPAPGTGTGTNPADAVAQCDAILVPSRWEPFGIAALQARAAGRVLAVAPVDGLRDLAATATYVCRGRSVRDWAVTLAQMADTCVTIPLRHPAECAAERASRAAWLHLMNGLAGETLLQDPRLTA